MSSIDERVVEMKFENSGFIDKARSTLDALRSLKDGLKLDGSAKGMQQATQGMAELGAQTSYIAGQFSALQAIAFGALTTIGTQALTMGQQLVSGLTIGPVSEGLSDYHQKLTSVQTIMNATGKSIEEVDGYFRQLDEYADKTIYNLSDMTSAFAKFTNAGVALDVSVPAIQGIANMTALAGQNAGAASIAMYNLSQSIAGGYLTRIDFKSLELANIATKEWKDYMIQAAVAAGELERKADGTYTIVASGSDKAHTANALFIDGLQEGWATTDVLLGVLGDYADVTTDIGRKAMAAAQDVKSFPMMMETLKAAVGTGWTDTFEILLGNVEESKELFTGLTLAIGGFLGNIGNARNELLQTWKDSGGRTVLIEGLTAAFQALGDILAPIGRAFRDIFPKTTAVDLLNITEAFRDWARTLKPSADAMRNIRETARGFFAVLDIGWEFIKAGIGFLSEMFGVIFQGSGDILDVTSNVGDFLVSIHDVIVEGELFQKFFERVGEILTPVINFIRGLVGAIGEFLGVGGDTTDLMSEFNEVGENMGEIADDAREAWEKFVDYLKRIGETLRPIGEGIMEFFRDIIEAVAGFLQGLSFDDVLQGVGVGAFAVIANALRKFLAGFSLESLFGSGEQPGWIQRISDALDQLTDSLQSMQNALNGGALLGIALAVGILALALIGLAGVPQDDLVGALIVLSLLMGVLTGVAKFMSNMELQNTGNLIAVSAALILISIAVTLLASAVKSLADADPKGLARGLASVIALLAIVVGISKYFTVGKTEGMIEAGIALILLAAAIKILASAVKDLSSLDWDELAKGLLGTAVLITALALFTKFGKFKHFGVASGTGLVLLATSILILGEALEKIAELDWHELARGMAGFVVALGVMVGALYVLKKTKTSIRPTDTLSFILIATSMLIVGEALEKLAELDWENFAKSLVSMGVALALMTGALVFIPKGAVFSGVALILAATSLLIVGEALEKLGEMSWSDILAGLAVMTVAMALIGGLLVLGGLLAATGVGGVALVVFAASLIIVAAAIYVMALAMEKLGAMSWSDIGAAIGGLTLLFIVLALGGALSPLILLLGAALIVLGVGVLAIGAAILMAGAGMYSFAEAIEKLSEIDAEGIDRVTENLERLLELIPKLAEEAALGIVAFVTTLGEHTGEMSDAVGNMIEAMAERLAEDTPIIVEAFGTMIVDTLTAMADFVPDMVQAAADLIVGLLNGITDNAGRVAKAGTDTLIAFMRGIGDNSGRLIDEGMKLIIKFLVGLRIAIEKNMPQIVAEAKKIGEAIIDGITEGLFGGSSEVDSAANYVAGKALASARQTLGVKSPSKKFIEIGQFVVKGFVQGLTGDKTSVTKAVNDMLGKFNDVQYDANRRAEAARESLRKLYAAREKDWHAIQKQEQALAMANYEMWRTGQAEERLINHLKAHRHKLMQLADAQTLNTKKLDEANDKLADAKKLRDDYMASTKEDLADRPEFTAQTNLTKYIADFERQIADTQKFATAVAELRKRGLNDTMYKELIAKGPEAMPFVQQLLDQGTEGVTKLNTLGTSLDKVAGDLATTASKALYQAGVDSAQGLVDGLKKKEKEIADYMRWLASVISSEMKKALGIRSPSKIFEEIGKQTTQGFANGLLKSSSEVDKSTDKVGQTAINSMRKTLAGLGDAITGEMDMVPVISPVLDLNAVRKDASLLSSMLAVKPIDITDQMAKASDAAAGLRDNQLALEELTAVGAGETINFTQNNYSPKALSSAEIYRNTNNQLSRAKGALAT